MVMEIHYHIKAMFQVVGPGIAKVDKGPTIVWGIEKEERQEEVRPKQRHKIRWTGSVQGMEKKNSQSSSDSLHSGRRNGTPRCERNYLQKHVFLAIPE